MTDLRAWVGDGQPLARIGVHGLSTEVVVDLAGYTEAGLPRPELWQVGDPVLVKVGRDVISCKVVEVVITADEVTYALERT